MIICTVGKASVRFTVSRDSDASSWSKRFTTVFVWSFLDEPLCFYWSTLTTWPQAGISILTQWLCSDVSQASAIVLYNSTFQRAGKWNKCGCQCFIWMEANIYLIRQGRARVWGGEHESVCVLGASGSNIWSIVKKRMGTASIYPSPKGTGQWKQTEKHNGSLYGTGLELEEWPYRAGLL